MSILFFFFFQAEDGIRDHCVTGVQTCALPISAFSSTAFTALDPMSRPTTDFDLPKPNTIHVPDWKCRLGFRKGGTNRGPLSTLSISGVSGRKLRSVAPKRLSS